MKTCTPTYWEEFRCLAGKCPDSCCKEWDVLVDPEAAARYQAIPGSLGDRLRQVLKKDTDGSIYMEIENRRCPMWRSDGLCRIQAELGEAALCQVCREFPRLRHDYGDFVELGLELSCPEAAKLILADSRFQVNVREAPDGSAPEYDEEAMELLLQTRETALDLLRDDRYSVAEALTLLLLFGCEAQSRLDGGEEVPFAPEAALSEVRRLPAGGDAAGFLDFFSGLEILTPQWANLLRSPALPDGWPKEIRSMAGYLIRRYWLQAVCDFDLYGRVKLIVASCLAVKLVGGDILRTAQLYSKEIENSAENIDAILDAAYTHPALTDQAFLGMLLK